VVSLPPPPPELKKKMLNNLALKYLIGILMIILVKLLHICLHMILSLANKMKIIDLQASDSCCCIEVFIMSHTYSITVTICNFLSVRIFLISVSQLCKFSSHLYRPVKIFILSNDSVLIYFVYI
jgi:hypothetical protein